MFAAIIALALVAAANLLITWGHWYTFSKIFVWAPPLFAFWHPHVGIGTPLAVIVAVVVVARGPELAARLRWPALAAIAYVTGVAWTLAVHSVDGWVRGVPGRIASRDECLVDVPRVTDIPMGHPGNTSGDVGTPFASPQQFADDEQRPRLDEQFGRAGHGAVLLIPPHRRFPSPVRRISMWCTALRPPGRPVVLSDPVA